MFVSKHLTKGDPLPPKDGNKLRLYSMHFCPYAQRVRIVLNAKNVPYDVVNVNLKAKPDWLFDLNAKGLVPILDTGKEKLIESLAICDYIDAEYPDTPLYTTGSKEADKKLISNFDELITLFYDSVLKRNDKTFSEHIDGMRKHLDGLEKTLAGKGQYFGGDRPNMVDYMIWPWAERLEILFLLPGETFNSEDYDYPRFCSWVKAMKIIKAVQDTIIDCSRHHKIYIHYLNNEEPKYDDL